MKKRILSIANAAVIALTCLNGNILPLNTKAEDTNAAFDVISEEELAKWAYIEEGDHISLLGYKGNEADVHIPNQIKGLSVTEISNFFFFQNEDMIRSLYIPSTITDLGEGLLNLPKLENIIIDEANKSYKCENNTVYTADGTKLIKCTAAANEELNIPDTVIEIADNAFSCCPKIKTINIPSSVKTISELAFKDSLFIEEINVDEKNRYYSSADGVLYDKYKESLLMYPNGNTKKEFSIPDGVREITSDSFSNADNLENVIIPDSVEKISDYSFHECDKLNNVVIPDSVAEIGTGAFSYCSSLSDISFSNKTYIVSPEAVAETPWYNDQPDGVVYTGAILYKLKGDLPENSTVTVKEGTIGINSRAFVNEELSDNKNLISVVLPDGIKYIGELAFYNCQHLKEINLTDSLERIGTDAFLNCFALKELHIPESMDTVEAFFNGCNSLEKIIIPSNIKEVRAGAFAECSSLNTIEFLNPYCSIEDLFTAYYEGPIYDGALGRTIYGYTGSTAQQYAEEMGYKFTSIEEIQDNSHIGTGDYETDEVWEWFNYGDHICLETYYGEAEVLELPDELNGIPVTEVSRYADVLHPEKIKTVKVPSSITELGNLFEMLENVSDIVIDKDNKSYIAENNTLYTADRKRLIRCCTGKVSGVFDIPDTVTKINDNAFRNCSQLTVINIPASVKEMDTSFTGCSSLASINVVKANQNYSSVNGVLLNKGQTLLYCYPQKHYGKYYAVPNTVSVIFYNAFAENDVLESVILPDKLKEIENGAFNGCDKLDNIVIPNDVASIGNSAFENCSSLKSIYFSDNTLEFGEKVMNGTAWLEAQPDGPVYCGAVFCMIKGTSSELTEIIVKDGTKAIADKAFSNGSDFNKETSGNHYLKTIVLPDSIEVIGHSAFYNCSALTNVNIPNGAQKNGFDTFCGCRSLEDIVLSETDTMIGYYEYEDCDSLKDIVIPERISYIGNNAFLNCSSLTSVTFMNPDCEINSDSMTICNNVIYPQKAGDDLSIVFNGTIRGYDGSTAEEYALNCGYKFISLGKSPKDYKLGDINDNSIVDAVDASMALSYYAKISTQTEGGFNEGQKYAADVNSDNVIDAVDASKILTYYAYASTEKGKIISMKEYITGVGYFEGLDVDGYIFDFYEGPDNTLVIQYNNKRTSTCYLLDTVSDKIIRSVELTDPNQILLGMFRNGTVVTLKHIYDDEHIEIKMYPEKSNESVVIKVDNAGIDGYKLDMNNNCIYGIDYTTKNIIKINEAGEISTHISLDKYSSFFSDNYNGMVFETTEASEETRSGTCRCLYSLTDGSLITNIGDTVFSPHLTKDSYTLIFNKAGAKGKDEYIFQVADINGNPENDKAYRLTANENEYLTFYGNQNSDYLFLEREISYDNRKIWFIDVENGKAAKAPLSLDNSFKAGLHYFNNSGQWILGVNNYTEGSSTLLKIDPKRLNFNIKLDTDDENKIKRYEPATVSESFREVRNEADKIEKEFGIRILVGNEVKNSEPEDSYNFISAEKNMDKYTVQDEIERLHYLGNTLAMYPEGFFEHFKGANGKCGLRISVVSNLESKNYSSFLAGGIAYTTGGWYDIALKTYEINFSPTIHHEIWHSVENLIKNKYDNLDEKEWAKLNPEGFVYTEDLDAYAEKGETDPLTPTLYNAIEKTEPQYEFPFFISDYSMVTPYEDRATLIEHLFYNKDIFAHVRQWDLNQTEIKKYPHLNAKYEVLENLSKQEFGYVYWDKMLAKAE